MTDKEVGNNLKDDLIINCKLRKIKVLKVDQLNQKIVIEFDYNITENGFVELNYEI